MSLLQPLNTAINKPFKQWLQEATDEYIKQLKAEKGADFKWSLSDKKVIITHVVSIAIKRLQNDPKLIKRAFLNCGISIRPDGIEDSFIRIKDIPSDQIDFTRWEEAEEPDPEIDDLVDSLCDEEELISMDDSELMLMTRYHKERIS